MTYTREQLDPSRRPYFKEVQPTDLYHERWRYPRRYFLIQEYVFGLGSNPEQPDTTLVPALQGVEYLLFLATGDTPLTEQNVVISMRYIDIPEFRNGALTEFPEFWIMVKDALLELPNGQEVLTIIHSLEGYEDLA